MRIHSLSLLIPICGLLTTPLIASADNLTLVNLAASDAPALTASAQQVGLNVALGKASDAPAGKVIVWEASAGSGTEISIANAEALGKFVQNGGSLLVTLAPKPGDGALRLSYLLPTIAWQTFRGRSRGAIHIAETDPAILTSNAGQNLLLPFYYEIRPFHATERGEARYERFAVDHPILNQNDLPRFGKTMPANNDFWTRPLLNRDWHIAARGDDDAQAPLLLTGRYGAGRVAVFASSLSSLPATPQSQAFLTSVLHWLTAPVPANAPVATSAFPAPKTVVDRTARMLRVTLTNPSNAPMTVQLLGRILTWEGALIGDQSQSVVLPASGTVVASIALPAPSATGYQAISAKDAFQVRLGMLSEDGRNVLSETKIAADLRPDAQLRVDMDDVRDVTFPFNAPAPDKPNRLGLRIDSYAYKPGQVAHALVTVQNGLRNLAPLAEVHDENDPNNKSVMALNDEAVFSEKGPSDGVQAYGVWDTPLKTAHDLVFTFPAPVTIASATLIGASDDYRKYLRGNPPIVVVTADGHEVARADDLDKRFVAQHGFVTLAFAPVTARVFHVQLPWSTQPGHTQSGVRLGEIMLSGTADVSLPSPIQGTLAIALRNSLTGEVTSLKSAPITVGPLTQQSVTADITLPADAAPGFYRVEATLKTDGKSNLTAGAPVMTVAPKRPLLPLTTFRPADAPSMGFIVTRGFRGILDVGIGTAEPTPGWAGADDLVWAYAHQFKQLGSNAHTAANRLYLSESDMRHYSTPWRDFPNGENFYYVGTPLLIDRMKQNPLWANSKVAVLSHSDRWDTGPSPTILHGWQDFEAFNDSLLAQGKPGLKGRTREELVQEIHTNHESEWQAWGLKRYVNEVRTLRTGFANAGKQLTISAQGVPLVPMSAEEELTQTIKGMSDDSTWGGEDDSLIYTTARQMSDLAVNPGWAFSTLSQWGWDQGVLGNWHWHAPVGTTEPSRRHQFDRGFRGVIRPDGTYTSMHTYGYNANGGYSYTMVPNDWQQWEDVQEKVSLLTPDGPLGAGVVVSTALLDDPAHVAFSGTGEPVHGMEDARAVMNTVRRLQEAGLSISFSANAVTLDQWTGTAPLILVNLTHFTEAQAAMLQKLSARGVPMIAFQGDGPLAPSIAKLFGVTTTGTPTSGQTIEHISDKPIVALGNRVLLPIPADDFTALDADRLSSLLRERIAQSMTFPAGTSGYGFTSNGRKFILVEDWREEGRIAPLRLKADPKVTGLSAVDASEHLPLTVHRDGADWVIDVPLRPGDGMLIALQEARS